ncbi:phospholemman isoform X3 [Bos indicus x Bos taurus]|uniref:phospholemman isoform X3 n=1 Tax=Bos indicus x Bos taurus TaxID=30522 RepID=UPI000F7D168B|nr:phospholemman isoform X3 [Bos indicus x Bos taurus]
MHACVYLCVCEGHLCLSDGKSRHGVVSWAAQALSLHREWQSPELIPDFLVTGACEPSPPVRMPGQWHLSATSWFFVWVSLPWSTQKHHRNTTHSPTTTNPCGSEAL